MSDLKFPIIRDPMPPPRRVSMEEYLAFVEFCWTIMPEAQKIRLREQRMREIPMVPFRLVPEGKR